MFTSRQRSGAKTKVKVFMVNVRQPGDIAQVLLSVLFLAIMIVACLWIVQPFILGFAWAGTIVIATWPVLLKLQKYCGAAARLPYWS